MRRLALLVLPLALAAAPARAADVTVSDTVFTPRTVTIAPGDSVNWRNAGGFHNVVFDDGSFEEPSDPSPTAWTASRRFDAPGRFDYHCELHGSPGGYGMTGTVVVAQPGAPVLGSLKMDPKRFCTRTTRRCPKPGARIRFNLSEAASVRVSIRPVDGSGSTHTFTKAGVAGANSIKYSGKKLARDLYRMTAVATDSTGAASVPRTATFRVAASR